MKTIDEYKKEILLMIMTGEILPYDFMISLPIDDDLRTFMCSLGPMCAYQYADLVDEFPRSITRKEACKDPQYAYLYAYWVDDGPCEDTRKAAYRDPRWKSAYIVRFGE